ncbi:hypothetical protein BD809_10776 [Aquimarina intermedia]|uniref:Uncharacterized protein n=1 Tax=Aquimarina intermedia TaxID=350814 RepID=A0A5S5C154_9FLAO|nr:hypothetical protein BD809_10776 [Aquimarina intermedia]
MNCASEHSQLNTQFTDKYSRKTKKINVLLKLLFDEKIA